MRRKVTALVALLVGSMLSGCAMFANWGEGFARTWKGVEATMTTYDENSRVIDSVSGTSFAITRDERFDTSDSEGGSNADSQVLLVSVGGHSISHVGSTLILAQEGLEDMIDESSSRVEISNAEPGSPIINDFIEKTKNLWAGDSKIILIRSQNGTPLAVFSGDNVEIFSPDVPKATQFRVDGKYLFVYRADYTVYDAGLFN